MNFIGPSLTLEAEVTNVNTVRASSAGPLEFPRFCRTRHLCCTGLLFLMAQIPVMTHAQPQAASRRANPVPEPAIPAILAAFDTYEVVGLPQGHGVQDLDDFIFSLIRTPAFSEKVNDIVFECGNSLYQPILDRYIAGEDVPFTEVQNVWRKTGQPACGSSGFVEQFFPLLRALNQKLPPAKRLRVLAPAPAIDWDRIKGVEDLMRLHYDSESSAASIVEKEVLAKHRKALMLFGTFHLMHGARDAVELIEKDYPNVAFIVSDLGLFDTGLPSLSDSKFVNWPNPALARAKGTWLGALDLSQFLPPGDRIDQDCNVHHEFPKALQKPMEDLVDAFLYLGPQDLRLREKVPADIALDATYQKQMQQGAAMIGFPGAASETPEEFDREIVKSASDPLFAILRPKYTGSPDPEQAKAVQACLAMKKRAEAPQ